MDDTGLTHGRQRAIGSSTRDQDSGTNSCASMTVSIIDVCATFTVFFYSSSRFSCLPRIHTLLFPIAAQGQPLPSSPISMTICSSSSRQSASGCGRAGVSPSSRWRAFPAGRLRRQGPCGPDGHHAPAKVAPRSGSCVTPATIFGRRRYGFRARYHPASRSSTSGSQAGRDRSRRYCWRCSRTRMPNCGWSVTTGRRMSGRSRCWTIRVSGLIFACSRRAAAIPARVPFLPSSRRATGAHRCHPVQPLQRTLGCWKHIAFAAVIPA